MGTQIYKPLLILSNSTNLMAKINMTHPPTSGKDTLPGPNHLSEVAQNLFEAWDVNCDLERFADTAQVYMV